MRTTKPPSPRHQVHEASIRPTGLEPRRRSSDAGPEQLICYTRRRKVLSPASASPTTSTQGQQLICYTRRKVLSPASATTSTQLALNDNEDDEDTGSNRDVRRGPVYGYFPENVSFAAIHEHRNRKGRESSRSPKRVGELSPFIRKRRRRRDVAPPVTTSVETETNCNRKPAPQRQTEPTDVQLRWTTYYSEDEHRASIDVKKSGESGPSSRSPKRVGELSPPIRKSKRTRRDVAPPVTTTVETGIKPAPQRQTERADVPFVWETYVPYPEGDEKDVPFPAVHEHRTSKNVEKSGESSKRVGELSPSIRKKKRTRRDVAPPPVTTSVETGSKPAPQRQREPTDVEFEWGTYYPEVMKMSWGPWSRARKEAISQSARSMKLPKKKKTRRASTASPEDFAQIIERTFADSRIVRCPNPRCEYHFRAILKLSQAL